MVCARKALTVVLERGEVSGKSVECAYLEQISKLLFDPLGSLSSRLGGQRENSVVRKIRGFREELRIIGLEPPCSSFSQKTLPPSTPMLSLPKSSES